jgi:hypothetical protein
MAVGDWNRRHKPQFARDEARHLTYVKKVLARKGC